MERLDVEAGPEVSQSDDNRDPAEGCGCVLPPRVSQPADPEGTVPVQTGDLTDPAADAAPIGAAAPASDGPPPQAVPSQAARPALKLVLTLHPLADGGYRALLSLGCDGFDPELRVCHVPDILPALDEVPALVAAARSRWQSQPRYPPLGRPSTRARGAPTTTRAVVAPPLPPSPPLPPPATETPVAPRSDSPPAPPGSGELAATPRASGSSPDAQGPQLTFFV